MDYLSAVPELNYMTQIVIMLYEDNNKVFSVLPSYRRNSTDSGLFYQLFQIAYEYVMHEYFIHGGSNTYLLATWNSLLMKALLCHGSFII